MVKVCLIYLFIDLFIFDPGNEEARLTKQNGTPHSTLL